MTVTDVTHQQNVKRLTKLPSVFKAEVTGLKLGRRYEVKVALDTSKGDGLFSNSTMVVTYNGNVYMCMYICGCIVCMCVSVWVLAYACRCTHIVCGEQVGC